MRVRSLRLPAAFCVLLLSASDPRVDDGAIARAGDLHLQGPGPSSGCGRPLDAASGGEQRTVDAQGAIRSYAVRLPASYDPAEPLALTIVFHGGGSDENGAMGFGLQNVEGAQAASVFVFPRGRPFEGHGAGWNDACGGYDMGFFDAMVAAVEDRYCIDTNRIFVAGFSWGCDFVTALACCRGERLRGIAAASCSDEFSSPDDVRTYANATCPSPNAAAIRFSHAVSGDPLYPAPLFATTAKLFQSLNHCSATRPPRNEGACRAYEGCTHPVIECAIPGIGHAPGPHWAEDTWRFFGSQR